MKDYCKNWFEENNVECPKFAKDWKYVGRCIPPNTSLTALRSKGLKPSDIINYIYGEGTASKNKTHNIDYTTLGLEFVSKIPNGSGHTTVEYKCTKCKEQYWTDQGTLVRWKDREVKYCPTCRGSSGKTKPVEYYQPLVGSNFNLFKKEGRHVHVQCLDCNFEFTRSITQIQNKETDNICCPNCDQNAKYVKGRAGRYGSLVEKELTEYLLEVWESSDPIHTQVLYSEFLDTERKFTADVFIPKHNTVIEITTKSNNLPMYKSRLEEKKLMCLQQHINFFVAYTKNNIKDIVQSLLKGKEV